MQDLDQKLMIQARRTRGYLQKKSSGFLAIWQKRYFIIINNKLCYYADETLDQVKKSILIDQIDSIKLYEDRQFHLITKRRIYQLQADSESSRDLWVASLNILLSFKNNPHSPTERKNINSSKNKNFIKHSPNSKKMTMSPKHSVELVRQQSTNSPKKLSQNQFSPTKLLKKVCLSKLSECWQSQNIRNKIIFLKQSKGCYFIISCKSLSLSYEENDFLDEQLVLPYDFNSLYYYQYNKSQNPQVLQLCKCKQIQSIGLNNSTISLIISTKTIQINVQNPTDLNQTIKKLKMAKQISKQYHNKYNIKLKRNIDYLIYSFQQQYKSIRQIVGQQFQKCKGMVKQAHLKVQFRKVLEMAKRYIKQFINACTVKITPIKKFKQLFIKEYNVIIAQYLHKNWSQLKQYLNLVQMKKIIVTIYQLWKLIKDDIKDDRLLSGSISIQEMLINKYEIQILTKMDTCFQLKENQLLDLVNIEGDNANNKSQKKGDIIFLSNNIFRQFHLDIRLILYEIPSLPTHQKTLHYYLDLFKKVFKHLSFKTYKCIDKWQNIQLILGTCNEIQCIKNGLFEQIFNTLTKQYKSIDGLLPKIKNQSLKQLQNQINNIEIMMIKKLFVMVFINIDRKLLNKNFDELSISQICQAIIQKLRNLTKMNKYVKKNIYQASFQQICYFYYTCIIKYNKKLNPEFGCDVFIRKINEDLKNMGKYFGETIQNQKIYTHLKDLSLIKELMHCDISQLKRVCQNLKKQFGNSFTQIAFKNLLSMRQITEEMYDKMINECFEIIKNSIQSPQDSFILSCKSQSFIENWNNTRSRKSTLTLSLNQFYQNQTNMIKNAYKCSKFKEGYLIRKKSSKNMVINEKRYFYRINNGQLYQFQLGNQEENQHINNYQLFNVRNCYIHPQKAYAFILEFKDMKLQFKAETNDQAKEWIKNVYQQINCLILMKENRDNKVEKDKYSSLTDLELQKDPSTMSSEHTEKNRSVQKSLIKSPSINKKLKKKQLAISNSEVTKANKPQKSTPKSQEGCYNCSRSLFS